jgi:hypothetical protein
MRTVLRKWRREEGGGGGAGSEERMLKETRGAKIPMAKLKPGVAPTLCASVTTWPVVCGGGKAMRKITLTQAARLMGGGEQTRKGGGLRARLRGLAAGRAWRAIAQGQHVDVCAEVFRAAWRHTKEAMRPRQPRYAAHCAGLFDGGLQGLQRVMREKAEAGKGTLQPKVVYMSEIDVQYRGILLREHKGAHVSGPCDSEP